MATTKATTLAHTLGGISSDISTAEINRLDGVTGDLQTQLDAKAPTASPTFTGTITAPNDSISGDAVSGGTIGAGTFSGTLSSSATLPAGTVLQVKYSSSTNGFGSGSTGTHTYYMNSNNTWGSDTTDPWGSIQLRQDNSSILWICSALHYYQQAIINASTGYFTSVYTQVVYSTNSNMSSPTTTANTSRSYEDARNNTGNVSQQTEYECGCSVLTTTNYSAGTTVYYQLKGVATRAGIYDKITLAVMEVAT